MCSVSHILEFYSHNSKIKLQLFSKTTMPIDLEESMGAM